MTDQGDGTEGRSPGPTPPVTSSDASYNDGMTHITQNIGVSGTSHTPPTSTTQQTPPPEKSVIASFRHSQAPDLGKQDDSSDPDQSLMTDPTRSMPYLD